MKEWRKGHLFGGLRVKSFSTRYREEQHWYSVLWCKIHLCYWFCQWKCRLLNFSSAVQISRHFKVIQIRRNYCPSVKQLVSGWDAELLGVSSGSKLFEYGTMVAIGGLRLRMTCEKRCNRRDRRSREVTQVRVSPAWSNGTPQSDRSLLFTGDWCHYTCTWYRSMGPDDYYCYYTRL